MSLKVRISNEFKDLSFFEKSKKAYATAGIKIEFVQTGEDVVVYKTSAKKMKALYPELGDSLSLTDRNTSPYTIHLCQENWNKVPKHLGSEYTDQESYRIALISHELAHALGHDHVHCACVGCPSDVRQQPSRGLRGCKPTTLVIFNEKSPFTTDNF
jgi:hypothetical protein